MAFSTVRVVDEMSEGAQTVSGQDEQTAGPRVTVFISYRREDTAGQALPLYEAFKERFGRARVFFDTDGLPGPFKDNIFDAIKRSDVLVALIGRRWLEPEPGRRRLEEENDVVRWELECALERGITLIPVFVGDAKMPDERDLPKSLARLPAYHGYPLDLMPHLFGPSLEHIISMVEEAARRQRDLELASGFEEHIASVRELLVTARREENEAAQATLERARATFELAKATAEEMHDELRREDALEELDPLERELAELERRIGVTVQNERDREAEVRVRDLLAEARDLVPEGKSEEARSMVDAAREAAQEISDDQRREEVLAEIGEIEHAIPKHWLERFHELLERARQQIRAGDVELAGTTLDSAREAAVEIDGETSRAEARASLALLEQELRGQQEAAQRGDFSAAEVISGPSGTSRRDNLYATKEPGETDHAGRAGGKSVWFRWVAPADGGATIDTFGSDFDTLLAVYRGSALADLEVVESNDDVEGTKLSRVRFPVVEGLEYMIAVDGYNAEAGEIVLNWEVVAPQGNDDFGSAEPIGGVSGTTGGDTTNATKQYGEPDHAGNAGGRSVWYRWTAPTSGVVTIDTFGSDFDTLLAVYRGSTLADLDPVASNDDTDGSQSRVTFPVAQGDEYKIAVDGYGGRGGSVVLNWQVQTPPANDSFDDAEEIFGSSGSVSGDSTGSSKEPGEPDHVGSAGGSSVWYRWSAPQDGIAVLDTFGSDYDTLLAVYRGSSLSMLDVVASNDDAGRPQSRVTFRVSAGDAYYVAVDGYAGAAGAYLLNWVITDRESLVVCLDAAGLRYREQDDGTITLRFPGSRIDELVVDAQESEGVAFFKVDLPAYSGFGAKGVLQRLLNMSYSIDYVKAMSLPSGGFAVAAEIPASALSQAVCEGLTWGLVALGDVRDSSDLKDGDAWTERVNNLKLMQDRFIQVDQDAARAEIDSLFRSAGLVSGTGQPQLDLGPERRSLTLHVSRRVISLMTSVEGVRPGGDKQKLAALLDLNRRVDIAKVGVDSSGTVIVLFEVPRVVPDLLEHLDELRTLYAGVRAAI